MLTSLRDIRISTLAAGLAVVTALSLAGCAGSDGATTPATTPSAEATAVPTAPAITLVDAEAELAALEAEYDARLGVYVLDTATGRAVAYRSDERFAYASTHKALLAAAILDTKTDAALDATVTYTQADLVDYSPVTELHVADGLPLRQIVDAAVRVSDNTAANLLVRELGGVEAFAAAIAATGDDVTRVSRLEPELNEATPGDDRDTSTPAAMASTLQHFALGDGLTPEKRAQLVDLMSDNATGDELIRAGVPSGWTVADKSGAAGYGTRNDIAIAWPEAAPSGGPYVLAVMSSRSGEDAEYDNALIAEATRVVFAALEE